MSATERTSLTNPTNVPKYVEFAGIIRRNSRNRIRQFQCCVCAGFILSLVMVMIALLSYEVSHSVSEKENITVPVETSSRLLQSSSPWMSISTLTPPSPLTAEEIENGIRAGNKAIEARRHADAITKPLPSPSPSSRHQYAVSTSLLAGRLALAATGEIAASKNIEKSRSFMGKPSSIGHFFDGGWAPTGACDASKLVCDRYSKYRTFDGTCNNRNNYGAAMRPFRRALPPDYADDINAPRVGIFGNELPSAREVSLKVHLPSPSTNPTFTVMLAVFGQFLDHDITATAISQGTNGSSLSCCPPSGDHPECFPVKVGRGDPVFDITGKTCMEFVRSAPAVQCKIGPRQQLNQATAFIDGSAIYGSNDEVAKGLREFSGGLLLMQITKDNRTLLPPSRNLNDGCNRELELSRGRYCFATGDPRANENLHLTTMHLIWARQHNNVAVQLSEINPEWDDEKLYQESRKIVGAQLQHVSYREFLPIVIGESAMKKRAMLPLKKGFKSVKWTDSEPTIANHFAAAAFRFAHTLLPGLMKVTDAQKGTSSYVQLHKMLFNPYSLYADGGIESSVRTATSNAIQKTSTHVTSQLTKHLFEDPIANVTVPCGLDLVSLNIQRGRDHGLPGYARWREYCGMPKPRSFNDLQGDFDPDSLEAISKLYDHVEDLDLYTGALAEVPRDDGIVGPTFTCLLADQFRRLQQGDRFWYEFIDQPGSFTEEQLNEIRKTSLARIICDCSDGITEIQAETMKSVTSRNPMISCEDILKLSLEAWRDSKSHEMIGDLEDTDYKEINDTINEAMLLNETGLFESASDEWSIVRNDLNETLTEMQNHLSRYKNVGRPLERLTLNETALMLETEKSINETIVEIVSFINAQKPPPDSSYSTWQHFKDFLIAVFEELKKLFAGINKADARANDTLMLENSTTTSAPTQDVTIDTRQFDWLGLRDEIHKTLMDIEESIMGKLPPPNATPSEWISFGQELESTLMKIRQEFRSKLSGNLPKLKATEETDSSTEISKRGNADDLQWEKFEDDMNKTLNDFQLKILQIKDRLMKNLSRITKRDLTEFQARLNEVIKEAFEDIRASEPTSDNQDIAAFRQLVKERLAKMKEEINAIKAEWLEKMKIVENMRARLGASSAASIGVIIHRFNISVIFMFVFIIR